MTENIKVVIITEKDEWAQSNKHQEATPLKPQRKDSDFFAFILFCVFCKTKLS